MFPDQQRQTGQTFSKNCAIGMVILTMLKNTRLISCNGILNAEFKSMHIVHHERSCLFYRTSSYTGIVGRTFSPTQADARL